MNQVTLNGQPVYYFTPDLMSHDKHQATGDELKTFGSIWHVVSAGGQTSAQTGQQGSPSPNPTRTRIRRDTDPVVPSRRAADRASPPRYTS